MPANRARDRRRTRLTVVIGMIAALASIAITVAEPALAQPQPAQQAACASQESALRAQFAGWRVSEEVPPSLRAGDKIRLGFRAPAGALPGPVYLVVATPEHVRFEGRYQTLKLANPPKDADPDTKFDVGPGFMAVPPGIVAPGRLEHARDRMRAIAPLHHRGLAGLALPEARTIGIEPLKAGPLTIEWTLVASTACGERVLAGPVRREYPVRLGRPEVVVQDLMAVEGEGQGTAPPPAPGPKAATKGADKSAGAKGTDKSAGAKGSPPPEKKSDAAVEVPQRVVVSNSGAYLLRIFRDRYEVLDAATGVRLVGRPGYFPNFSPTSRFITARVGGTAETNAHLDIVDLAAGRLILNISGPTLAWSHGDSLAIAGGTELQQLALSMALIDRAPEPGATGTVHPHTIGSSGTGREADAWNSVNVFANYAGGNAVIYSFDTEIVTSLFDGVGRIYGDTLSLFGLKQQGDFAQAVGNALGRPGTRLPWGWHGDAPVRLSQRCNACDSKESRSDFDGGKPLALVDGSKQRPFQRDAYLAHKPAPSTPTAVPATPQRQGPSAKLAAAQARSGWTEPAAPGAPVAQGSDLRARLAEFGLPLAAHTVIASASFKSLNPVRGFIGEYPKPLQARLQPLFKDLDWDSAFIAGQWTFKLADRSVHVIQHGRAANFGWETDHVVAIGFEERPDGAITNAQLLSNLLGDRKAEKDTPRRDGVLTAKHWTAEIVRFRVAQLQDGRVVIGAPAADRIAILDTRTLGLQLIDGIREGELMTSAVLTADGRTVVQINQSGQFFAYDVASGRLVVSGRHADGELIMHDEAGYFTGTYEGAHFLHLRFPGEPGLHSFHQFQSRLYRPDIIAAALKGTGGAPPAPDLAIPPTIELGLAPAGGQSTISVTARSGTALQAVRLYQDGQLTDTIAATGRDWQQTLPLRRLNAARWLTAVAVDERGILSQPAALALPADAATGPAGGGTLHGVLVGVDEYDHPSYKPLRVAARDARDMAAALTANAGRYYASVALTPLADAEALPRRIIAEVESIVANARAGDTVVLFFAGHGARDGDGQLYLATTGTTPDNLKASAVPWSRLAAALRRSKARVIVMLDACHSGAAGEASFASNDAAVAEIMSGASAPILILAASKGRQLSLEDAALGNGYFTRAMKQVLGADRRRRDLNGNGVLEISEFYRAVKGEVVRATGGRQTPWLARSDLIGDFALF